MRNNNTIIIMAQAFYGNRTVTEITPESFDAFMLGHLDMELSELMRTKEKIDRTIIPVPGTENVVFVYNKYQEEKYLEYLQDFVQNIHKDHNRFNPTVVIPERGIVLYSRCIACRINEAGELTSLERDDCPAVVKYLTA